MKIIFVYFLTCFYILSQDPTFPELIKDKKSKIDYLTGNFSNEHLVKVSKDVSNNPKRDIYLRKEVLEAYKKLSLAFSKDHPKIKLKILSSFRTYNHQKRIWERKFELRKKKKKTEKQIVNWILQYSSAPSTSRHHWGTDIDINSFENEFFEKK